MIADHIVAIIFKLKYIYMMVLCVNPYLFTRQDVLQRKHKAILNTRVLLTSM